MEMEMLKIYINAYLYFCIYIDYEFSDCLNLLLTVALYKKRVPFADKATKKIIIPYSNILFG